MLQGLQVFGEEVKCRFLDFLPLRSAQCVGARDDRRGEVGGLPRLRSEILRHAQDRPRGPRFVRIGASQNAGPRVG